jgi:hypothetical protein
VHQWKPNNVTTSEGSSVVSMLVTSRMLKKNRHVLQKINEVILLCGRQNIPLRGHVEKRSNFFAILHEIAKTDQVLSDRLEFNNITSFIFCNTCLFFFNMRLVTSILTTEEPLSSIIRRNLSPLTTHPWYWTEFLCLFTINGRLVHKLIKYLIE